MVRLLCIFAACAPNLYQCNNEQCVTRAEVCDGQNNCGDLSDEFNCGRYIQYFPLSCVDALWHAVGPTKINKQTAMAPA